MRQTTYILQSSSSVPGYETPVVGACKKQFGEDLSTSDKEPQRMESFCRYQIKQCSKPISEAEPFSKLCPCCACDDLLFTTSVAFAVPVMTWGNA
eukprot:419748-Pelagomonas_calceolata.AAC.2